MAKLNTAPNLPFPDEVYQLLTDLPPGATDDQIHAYHARLILCLANHIGDIDVLKEAVTIAKT